MARILLVDDDEDIAFCMTEWLVFQEHQVETAQSGPEALEQLRFGTFDVAILDWTLPGLSGVEVCRQFRKSGGTTPIIMMTGRTDRKDREQGLEAGASEFLIKPCDIHELSATIERLTGKS